MVCPRGLCDSTLDADKAVLPSTKEMGSDWGQGQSQEELPGIDGALDLLCLFPESTRALAKTLVAVRLW